MGCLSVLVVELVGGGSATNKASQQPGVSNKTTFSTTGTFGCKISKGKNWIVS